MDAMRFIEIPPAAAAPRSFVHIHGDVVGAVLLEFA